MAFNQKGQAFSTFQLLIAAIVAMAILGILIPIIMQVMGIITKDPTNETKTLIGNMYGQPGNLQYTDAVTFSPQKRILASSALVEGSPVSADQICMLLGELEGSDFSIAGESGNQRIIFNGGSSKQVKIGIVCNTTAERLNGDLQAYFEDQDLDCTGQCPTTGPCCAILLKR